MSAASETKIFGIKVGVDPKYILVGLLCLAAVLYFVMSHSSGETSSSTSSGEGLHTFPAATASLPARTRARLRRDQTAIGDWGTLRIRPVDASRGDVDPTLRLDLLARLQDVEPVPAGRSLFELGPVTPMPTTAAINKMDKKIQPGPLPSSLPPNPTIASGPPPVNIPLKFYGFMRPAGNGLHNRGLFLDGENVIVASEGEMIDHRYLVVSLTPADARMEDTQVKQGQTLPVTPEANAQ